MTKVTLLLIDPQKDFHPGGSLAVPNSDKDTERVSQLIRERGHLIDDIIVTMDTHHKTHIAHGVSWFNKKGEHPAPFTLISSEEIENGTWIPTDIENIDWYKFYTKELEQKGRFTLCIWPEHCILGTVGHAVVDCLNDALQEWAGKKYKMVNYVLKGQNRLTEMYSAVTAEVPDSSDPATMFNRKLIDRINTADKLIIAGQAMSHCVNFTTRDVYSYWNKDPSSMYLLLDGSSAVPGFESKAEKFVEDMKEEGLTLTTTEELMKKWFD